MNESVTFRQLESSGNDRNELMSGDSSLDDWYRRIRDTPISELDDGDLSRACRQCLYLDHIVPISIARLEEEPLAGDIYDGELLVAMKLIPTNYWKNDQRCSEQLLRVVDQAKKLSDDEDIINDVDELAERIGTVR